MTWKRGGCKQKPVKRISVTLICIQEERKKFTDNFKKSISISFNWNNTFTENKINNKIVTLYNTSGQAITETLSLNEVHLNVVQLFVLSTMSCPYCTVPLFILSGGSTLLITGDQCSIASLSLDSYTTKIQWLQKAKLTVIYCKYILLDNNTICVFPFHP